MAQVKIRKGDLGEQKWLLFPYKGLYLHFMHTCFRPSLVTPGFYQLALSQNEVCPLSYDQAEGPLKKEVMPPECVLLILTSYGHLIGARQSQAYNSVHPYSIEPLS